MVEERQGRRTWIAESLGLLGLAALVVAQPILDLLARHATFFVARRLSPGEIVGLAVVLLALPLPLVATLSALRRSVIPRRPLLAAGVAVLALPLALQMIHESLDGVQAAATALVVSLLAAIAVGATGAGRQVLRLLAWALVAVPAAFLLQPPVRQLLANRGQDVELAESGAGAPVVFVVFDELAAVSILDRDGQLDAERFPGFAALAARSTRYANALSASDTTEYAVPALLTGRLPRLAQLPTIADHPQNLFTAFGGDYRIVALEDVTQLCPPSLDTFNMPLAAKSERWRSLLRDLAVVWGHLTLPQPWRDQLPSLEARWAGFAGGASSSVDGVDAGTVAPDRPSRFRSFLRAIEPAPVRTLYVHHNNLPHWPWEYLPSGRRYAAPPDRIPGLLGERWQDDEQVTAQAMQRYLLQLQLVDGLVGELLSRLEEVGILDQALVVVTADHGVSFRPGDARRLFTETNRSDVLTVPLFIKAPRQERGEVVTAPVSAIDVLPTIFDLLGVPLPWPVDGVSMRLVDRPTNRRVLTKYQGLREVDQRIDVEKLAMLRRQHQLFGGGAGFAAGGLRATLVDRPLATLEVAGSRTVPGFAIDGARLFQEVDPESPLSPVWLSGTLGEWPEGELPDLVVGVNGRVAATTRGWRSPDGSLRFSALLPERVLEAGRNELDVLVEVTPERFVRLERPRETRRLLDETGAIAALSDDRERHLLVPGAVDGWFGVGSEGGTIVVQGWAWDRPGKAPAKEVVLLSGGQEVFAGSPDRTDPPVATTLGVPASSLCGFRFELPEDRVPDLRRRGVRAIAIANDGRASELGVFYRLVEDADGAEIRVSSGRVIPVRRDLVGGWLDRRETDASGRVLLEGWAASPAAGGLPEQLLTFAGDRCIHLGAVTRQRPDVAQHLGRDDLVACGFRFVASPPEGAEVRTFAVFPDNTAAELRLWPPPGAAS